MATKSFGEGVAHEQFARRGRMSKRRTTGRSAAGRAESSRPRNSRRGSGAGLPADRFWSHLIPLSAMGLGRRQLVETAVAKTVGRGARGEAIVADLDGCIADVEAAMRVAVPNVSEELALRERPARAVGSAAAMVCSAKSPGSPTRG